MGRRLVVGDAGENGIREKGLEIRIKHLSHFGHGSWVTL